jgi:hypothetical protein
MKMLRAKQGGLSLKKEPPFKTFKCLHVNRKRSRSGFFAHHPQTEVRSGPLSLRMTARFMMDDSAIHDE